MAEPSLATPTRQRPKDDPYRSRRIGAPIARDAGV